MSKLQCEVGNEGELSPFSNARIPFQFAEDKDALLYHELHIIGPGPAAFFRDACFLMSMADEEHESAFCHRN